MFFLLSSDSTSSTGLWGMLGIYAVFIVVLYLIMIRPQRRRQKETDKMQKAIALGDWVLLNSGMYGKVVNIVNDCLMIEFGTNKSVIVPVRRDQVASKGEPNLTQQTVDESAVEPTDDLVGDDLEEDGLDDYDKYLIEKGEKKKRNKTKTKEVKEKK